MRCQIATPWQSGTNAPQLDADHALPSGASWMDATGQQVYQLPPLPDAYVVECWHVDQAWIDAVAADSNYLVLWTVEDDTEPDAVLTSQQLTAIRSYFAGASSDQVDHYVGTATDGRTVAEVADAVREWSSLFLRQDEMSDADYAALVNRYPQYAVGVSYAAGELVAFEDALYEVVQPHTSQADWRPDATPALYTHAVPQSVIGEWVQPTGAHDAYALGAQVTHNGQVWESDYDANIWEPGVFGWHVVS